MDLKSRLRDIAHWTGVKKKKVKPGSWHDDGYPKAEGRGYWELLTDFHARANIEWYLEIGTANGRSLAIVNANVVAVDPAFTIKSNVLSAKSEAHFFQKTSDDFFASGFLDRFDIRFDMAFLDGMHRFEFLLRDFMNSERYMKPRGRILLHDCVPFNRVMSDREWNAEKTSRWTGDVWKMLPILAAYRPDLQVTVLNAATTGLVSIGNLDAASKVLEMNYSDILSMYMDMTLESYGLEKFTKEFPLVDCEILLQDVKP